MKNSIKVLLVIIAFIVTMMVVLFIKLGNNMKNLSYYEVDMDTIDDGIYRGKADTILVKVELEVIKSAVGNALASVD